MKRLIVFVILAALLLTGCSGTAPITQQTYAMDTLMTFTVWSKDGYYITEALSSLMDQLESEWSATDNKSIISKLNRGETVELDDEQKAFLEQVEALSVRTRGARSSIVSVRPGACSTAIQKCPPLRCWKQR